MMDTEILEMLEDIGRSSVARLSPAIYLSGETAQARRDQVLTAIQRTILPRRLEFVAADETCLAIEVSSSRITDVFECRSTPLPDFETESREDLTEKLARLVTEIAKAPGPLKLASLRPDAALEADDVGLTFSEVESACAKIKILEEPRMTVVPEAEDELVPERAAEAFFGGADRFALGRFLVPEAVDEATQADGLCAMGQPAHPEKDLLLRLARDLSGWQKDSDTAVPQLIVMRPSGGQGAGLALVHDGQQIAGALHDARKLGAVVNLWKSLKPAAE